MDCIKNFNFLKQNLFRLLHISSTLKMYVSSLFIMSSSLAQLSAAFSVLLAAITHFTLAFCQCNKHSNETSYFCRTILGLVGKISSWLKINKRWGLQ